MSVVVTVAAAGVVVANSAALLAMASTAAAALGLRAIEQGQMQKDEEDLRLRSTAEAANALAAASAAVTVGAAMEAALASVVAERCEAEFSGSGLVVRMKRDIRGKLSIEAHGSGTTTEVQERAHQFLGLLQQQIAYREVVRTLKARGFEVAAEERLADGTARVRVVRR
jgi:hypothetical protein